MSKKLASKKLTSKEIASKEIASKKTNSRITFSARKKSIFLRKLSQSCNVAQSAEATGVSVDTVYRHRKTDVKFRDGWNEAIEIAYDELMLEMLCRARFGTEKPIIYGGKKVGVFNDMNDTMAMRLLSLHLANVAQLKTGNITDMTQHDETHQLLMQRLSEIKKRLFRADDMHRVNEMKSINDRAADDDKIEADTMPDNVIALHAQK